MEIGLDYMHIRSRAEHYGLRWTGIALLLVGLGLALAGGSYYGYIFWLRYGLDDYNAERPGLVQAVEAAALPAADGSLTVRELSLPPGVYDEQAAKLGFTPLSGAGAAPDSLPAAAELRVKALDIKVSVAELHSAGESVASYAMDSISAGQLDGFANPGEQGAMWLFGPAGGGPYGFSNLTRAPQYLAETDGLPIIVSSDEQDYLYLATHTDVIPASDLALTNADRATVHLAVPVPDGLYDHFLILSGELVGKR